MSNTATLNPTPPERHRFHLLDALRGLAAIVVFFWHIPGTYNLQGRSNGYLAVDFFFCLSGFVVAFSYERRLMDNLSFKQFVLARMLRLHPLYLLGLLCGLLVYLFSSRISNFTALHFVHLFGFFALQTALVPNIGLWPSEFLFPFNDVSWSLFFEIFANILYAWAICRRVAGTFHVIAVCFVSAAVLGVFALYKNSFDVGPWNHRGLPFAVARVLLSFCIGVLVMRAYRALAHRPLSLFANGTLVLLTVISLLALLLSPVHGPHQLFATFLTVTVGFPLVLLSGAICRVSGPLVAVAVMLGNLSYPFYILHQSCIHAANQLQGSGWVANPIAGVVVELIVCIILSGIALRYIDLPVRGWLARKLREIPVPLREQTQV